MLKRLFIRDIWTSKLDIFVEEDYVDLKSIYNEIDGIIQEIEFKYSSFPVIGFESKIQSIYNSTGKIRDFLESDLNLLYCLDCNQMNLDQIISFSQYDINKFDMTGILKGYAINRIYQVMRKYSNQFFINFGGDILGYNLENSVKVCIHKDFTGRIVDIKGSFVVFSSGNYDSKRKDHIKNADPDITAVTTSSDLLMPIRADYLATKSMTDKSLSDDLISVVRFDKDGKEL